MSEIKDHMFAEFIMGPCAAIEPADGKMCSCRWYNQLYRESRTCNWVILEMKDCRNSSHLGLILVKITDEKYLMKVQWTESQKGDLLTVMDLDGGRKISVPENQIITIVTNHNSYTDIFR